jgi:hypothetical protein
MTGSPSLLTIGMPVYKGGQHGGSLLRRCLDSLLRQTFKDFQVIIVDNDSQDDTANIILPYVQRDVRFIYRKNPVNMGVLYNFARLVTACQSKYYQELHFDTYLAPTCLEEYLKVLEADQAAVIAYSHCQFVDAPGNFLDLCRDTADFAHDDPGERYINVLTGMGWCTAYHGLWRHEILAPRQVKAMGRINAAWDNEFLALAALRGKLRQIPNTLFFRFKDDYQRQAETIEARYSRLYYSQGGCGYNAKAFFLPFCTWIRDHCHDLLDTDLPLARKDELIHKTVSVLLKRYKHMVDFELGRAVELVLKGEFAKEMVGPDEVSPPKGQYRFLDYVYLSQLVMDLEFAQSLRPDFPKLALARAVVKAGLGQQREALAALEAAYRQDPADQQAQALRAGLEAVLKAKRD